MGEGGGDGGGGGYGLQCHNDDTNGAGPDFLADAIRAGL
jgi:hypothetical protein